MQFAHARFWLPLGFEVVLAFASGRVAWLLIGDDHYFDKNPEPFAWVSNHISGQEWHWGLLALIACMLKVIGMLGLLSRRDMVVEATWFLREIGWAASFLLWASFGVSVFAWSTHTIASTLMLAIAALCLGMMVLGPVMPRERKR